MKVLIFVVLMFCMVSMAIAGEWAIEPRYQDLTPGDGFCEAGSPSNPFVIRNSSNHEIAEVKPRYQDLQPGDGFCEEGTSNNPYIIDWE